MPIYTVRLRATVHVDTDTQEDAEEIARITLARGWANMALGHPAIVRGDDREFVVVKARPTRKLNWDGRGEVKLDRSNESE